MKNRLLYLKSIYFCFLLLFHTASEKQKYQSFSENQLLQSNNHILSKNPNFGKMMLLKISTELFYFISFKFIKNQPVKRAQVQMTDLYPPQYKSSDSLHVQRKSNLKQILIILRQDPSVSRSSWPSSSFFQRVVKQIQCFYQVLKIFRFIADEKLDGKNFNIFWNSVLIIESFLQLCINPVTTVIEALCLPQLEKLCIQSHRFTKSHKHDRQLSHQQKVEIKNHKMLSTKCAQIISIWTSIKPHQIFEQQQIRALSKFSETLQSLKNHKVLESPYHNSEMSEKINQHTKKFHKNLTKQQTKKSQLMKSYQFFFRHKFIEQVNQGVNIFKGSSNIIMKKLLSSKQNQIPQMSDINLQELYQILDPTYTTPLNGHIMFTLQEFQHPQFQTAFQTRKQTFFAQQKIAINLLSKLIRWGDIQAYLNATYNQALIIIGLKVLEVKGNKSLSQGENIFNELGEGYKGKLQFYKQFMKFLDIFGCCHQKDLEAELQDARIRQIYRVLKERKYKFPQNLMLTKVKADFDRAILYNVQRNQLILFKIKNNPSVFTGNNQIGGSISPSNLISGFNQFIDICQDQIYILCNQDNPTKLVQQITQLKLIINDLQLQKQMIQEQYSHIGNENIQNLRRSENIINRFKKIEIQCDKFKKNQIPFRMFKDKLMGIIYSSSRFSPVHNQKKLSSIRQSITQSYQASNINNQAFYSSINSNLTHNSRPYSNIRSISPKNKRSISKDKDKSISFNRTQVLLNQSISNNSFNIEQNKTLKSIKLGTDSEMRNSISLFERNAILKNRLKSQRIQKILQGLKKIVHKNSQLEQFQPILTQSALQPADKVNIQYLQQSMSPRISKNVQKDFKNCLDVNKLLLKQKKQLPRAYKKTRKGPNSYLSSALHEKQISQNFEITNSTQSTINIVPIFKKNPIPDSNIGKLIDFKKYIPNKNSNINNFDSQQITANKVLFKNDQILIEIYINPHKNQNLYGTFLVYSYQNIIQFQICQRSFFSKPTINLNLNKKSIAEFKNKTQVEIEFKAELIKIQQNKFPSISVKYLKSNKKVCEFNLDVPFTLHNFSKFSQIKGKPAIIKETGMSSFIHSIIGGQNQDSIIRTDLFYYDTQKVRTQNLSSYLRNIQLVFKDKEQKFKIYAVSAQLEGFSDTDCELYLKIYESHTEISKNDGKMIIYGAMKGGNLYYMQAFVSIIWKYFTK